MVLSILATLSSHDLISSSHSEDPARVPVSLQQSSPLSSPLFGYVQQWGSIGGLSSPNGLASDVSGNLYLADAQNYGVGKMARNGTLLSLSGGYGSAPGHFLNPFGVAVDSSGNVFATDSRNNDIVEFSSTGAFVRSWNSNGNGTLNGMLSSPLGVAVNGTNYVYVVDTGHQRVGIFHNDGSFVKYFSLRRPQFSDVGNFTQPVGIAIDSQGSVYVDDQNVDLKDPFSGNVTKFTKNGAFINSWGGANLGGTFFMPQGLAVDSSFNIYVVDALASRVQKYSTATSNPSLVWSSGSYGTTPGHFQQPIGVTLDNLGNVFVSDPANFNVQQFLASTGANVASLSYQRPGYFSRPLGVALDNSGGVYVADHDNDRVQRFNALSGAFLSSFGSPGSLTGQFNGPTGVAVDHNGNVFVSDYGNNRVQEFTSAGVFVRAWGSQGSGNGQFCGPSAIAVDSSNNVYVTDYNQDIGLNGCSRVEKFDGSGNFVAIWGSNGSAPGQFFDPQGITVDQSSGYVYVGDSGNNRIVKLSSSGVFLTSWGSLGTQAGQFNVPMGLGLDSAGNIFVADTLNSRVQMFLGNGTFRTAFGSSGPGNGQFAGSMYLVVDSSDRVYVSDNNLYNSTLANNRVEVFIPFHDTAVPRFNMSRNTAFQNVLLHYPIVLNVTVSNLGSSNETFWLNIYANSTLINSQTLNMTAGQSRIVGSFWNPLVSGRAAFNMTAQVQTVIGDPNPANNMVRAGFFYVRLTGDISGDCRVDVSDLAIVGSAFSRTFGQSGYNSAGDLNNDYVIDVSDLALVGANFGRSC